MLLGVESATIHTGLWRSRKMISSLAQFFRTLFGLVCPNQVIKIIKAYFKATRKYKRVEEAGYYNRLLPYILFIH